MPLAPASQAPVAGASLSNAPWKIKLQIRYTLLLEFIFSFSMTGYRLNNICLHQIGKKF